MRVAILISGRGSNMAALIAAAAAPGFPAEIALVLADRVNAPGLERARASGIATDVVAYRDFAERPAFEAALDRRLRAANIDLICLAGFMRLLSAEFVAAWPDRILNIHPSLLPSFPGLDTHRRALAAGVRVHGATVHFIRAAVDNGPIVAQAAVPVRVGDTPEQLAARVLAVEHRIYPLALRLVAEGRAEVNGDTVALKDVSAREAPPLVVPTLD